MNARWRREGGREGRGGRGTSWKSSSISVSLLKINIPDPGTKDWTGRSARFRFVSFPLLLPQLRHRITERIVARREKKKSFDPSLPHLTYYYAIRLSSCFQLTHPAANPWNFHLNLRERVINRIARVLMATSRLYRASFQWADRSTSS